MHSTLQVHCTVEILQLKVSLYIKENDQSTNTKFSDDAVKK